ncbi:MAG: insulinase family protein [Candidatus Lambdaproteobacteria bacterium]|nr:insulinase family protein [Candidatus Lambdaproteobacteria bacterium]
MLMLRVAMLRWIVLAFAALLLGACEPRSFVSESVERLLTSDEVSVRYRRLVLPNELKVMLVSDPRVDLSAAAMAVGAGFQDDPADRQGLAHFLEHMLFLGTEKYPEAGAYQRFMSDHSGFGNAYTSIDHTNYHFEVAHDAFEEGLDRFSQFFVAPLFNEEFTAREVNAVDSEHSKNIDNDFWRAGAVLRTLYRPEHPLSRFGTGSLATLKGVGRDELMRFYRQHYSSNRMTLALVSNRPLDELEALVRGRFGNVPNRHLAARHVAQDYLPRAAALRLLTIEPVKDVRMLGLEFPLPPAMAHYRAQPLRLIGGILGHEGAGSLLSVLKEQGLATGLSAGAGYETADFASLHIVVQLTPEGLQDYRRVLRLTLGTIRALREAGIPRHLFEEQRVMAELNYRYRDRMGSDAIASTLSAAMQDLPLDDLPEGQYLLRDYEPGIYREFLEALTPDNMLVSLMAKGLATGRTETYYGTSYGYREERGPAFDELARATADVRWHVPAPNPYIPRHVRLGRPEGALKLARTSLLHLERVGLGAQPLAALQAMQGQTFANGDALLAAVRDVLPQAGRPEAMAQILKSALALPRRLADTERAKIWYLPDWRFRKPKAEISLKIYTDPASDTARHAMLGQMYTAAFEEAQNERAYPVREAGLGFAVSWGTSGVTVGFSGYSDRMLDLVGDVFARLPSVELSEQRFAALKEQALRGLQSERFAEPYRQSRYYSRLLLERPAYTREELERELSSITLAEVRAFAARLYQRIYVEGVVVGNLPPELTREALAAALNGLGGAPLPPGRRLRDAVNRVPSGDWYYGEQLPVGNSYVGMVFDAGPRDPQTRGALLTIQRMLGSSFYNDMRTQQQLGYIVYGGMSERQRIMSLIMIVQSGAYGPDVLQSRMDGFVPRFIQSYRDIPPEQFETLRRAVVEAKLEREKDIGEVAERLYWTAFKHDEQWDYMSTDIEAVERLTKADTERVLERVLAPHSRRRLSIRLTGKEHAAGISRDRAILPGNPLLREAS